MKAFLRRFKREKFFTLLNIASLSLGIFCFLVVALFVRDELTHDQWHGNVNEIYIAKVKWGAQNGQTFYIFPPLPYTEEIKTSSPGILDAVNISNEKIIEVKIGNTWVEETKHYHATTSIFNIFDFTLKLGDPSTALDEPNSIVLSSDKAFKYFGLKNPIGEFIEIKDRGLMKVTGVMDPIPANSHLRFDLLTPRDFTTDFNSKRQFNWGFGGDGIVYLLTAPGYSMDQVQKDTKALLALNSEDKEDTEYVFESFGKSYLNQRTMRSDEDNMFGGDAKYVYIFSLVGFLILIVACFNYINLTSARSFTRTKEVMVRKIIGASKKHLILRFIGESFLFAFIALIVALVALEFTLPTINSIIGKQLGIDYLGDPTVLWLPISLTILVALLAGIYPAMATSTFNLASILKGDSPKSGAKNLRKALVVLQFMICGGLLISTLIIRGQAKYLLDFDLGYKKENVININLEGRESQGKYPILKSALEKLPLIQSVSGSPLPEVHSIYGMEVEIEGEKSYFTPFFANADKGFEAFFGLEILEGKSFDELQDSELDQAVMINEAALKQLGLENPIGFKLADGMKITSVIRDFHYSSAKSKVGPLIIMYNAKEITNLHIRFDPKNIEAVIAATEGAWSSLETNQPFEFELLEGHFESSYNREKSLVQIFDVLTIVLIAVAFLGLFALASFEAKQREKEVGIRKVLGANYFHLVKILGQRFIWLIFFALVLAIPISYYLLENWLQTFPNHLSLNANYFIVAIMGVLTITMGVLGIHGYTSANKNPVSVLKNQ